MGPTGADGEITVPNISGGTWTVSGTILDVTGSVSGATFSLTGGALDVGGSMSDSTVTLNGSDLDVGGSVSGTNITLNNGSLALLSSNPGATTTITYGSGTDTGAITTIGSTNNVAIRGLDDGDSIAESNIAFNSATLSGSTLTLKENGTTVATFTNVTLSSNANSTTFEPVTTEVIDGKTYYVATLDPPSSSGATGANGATGATGSAGHTGATGASGTSGGAGGNDKLTAEINPGTLFGSQDQGPRFLYTAGPAAGQPGHVPGAQGTELLIRAGTDFVQNFSLAQGDTLDLTKILAGVPLAHDLANLGEFVKVLGYGKNDPGFGAGTKTTLEVTGLHGTAVVNLEGAGKLDLQDLLKHQSLILPPH
jgi:collagen type VII alpha